MSNLFQFFIFAFASFRLTRLLVFDKITAFIRRPFLKEIEELNEEGSLETYIEIKGSGLRAWIGELLSCFWCTGIWSTAIIYLAWSVWPQGAEPVIFILGVAGIAGVIETLVLKWQD